MVRMNSSGKRSSRRFESRFSKLPSGVFVCATTAQTFFVNDEIREKIE